MNTIIYLLMIALGIICALLIGVILIQRSKGQGTGLSFGGGAEAVFGAQMGNVLTRATVVLAILFLVITTLFTVLRPHGVRSKSMADQIEAQNAGARGGAADSPYTYDGSAAQQEDALNNVLNTEMQPLAPITSEAADEADEADEAETPKAEPEAESQEVI